MTGPGIDDLYNHTLSAFAISASWELGLLDRLENSDSPVDLRDFSREQDLDAPSVEAIARGLALADVVVLSADRTTAKPGPLFADTLAKKGFFYWLTRGCGELFTTMPELVRNANRPEGFTVRRDYKAIGLGAREAGFSYVDPVFYKIIADRGLRHGADLGCGSGERLIKLAGSDPEFAGSGWTSPPERCRSPPSRLPGPASATGSPWCTATRPGWNPVPNSTRSTSCAPS